MICCIGSVHIHTGGGGGGGGGGGESRGGGEGRGGGGGRPRRGFIWPRRPLLCGRPELDAVSPPRKSSAHTYSPPSVGVERNRVTISRPFMRTDPETGQRHPVIPLSAFWDPDFADHGSPVSESQPGPEVFTTLQTPLVQLFFNELREAEPLPPEPEIFDDPNPLPEIDSLPPTPRTPPPDIFLCGDSWSNSPTLVPLERITRSQPPIPLNVVDLSPRPVFSADNVVEENREMKSAKARHHFWDMRKKHAGRQIESLVIVLTLISLCSLFGFWKLVAISFNFL